MVREDLIEMLDAKGIPYEISTHAPVFTIEEMLEENLPYPEAIAKNLFIRDDKKRNYYLITVREDRRINLKEFQKEFGTRSLSFASEKDLGAILELTRGAVTPFGLLNDRDCKVQLFVDEDFLDDRIGIHPLENTATVWMSTNDLIDLVKEHGNSITVF